MTYDDALSLIGDAVDPGVLTDAGIDHLSYSNLRLLDECSNKWQIKYIQNALEFKRSYPMAVGSGVHRAIEYYHLSHSPESAYEAGVAKFKAELGHYTEVKLQEAQTAIQRMLNCYQDKYEQKVVATEREYEFDLAHDLSLQVVIDVVEEGKVADIKSIARKREEFTPDELQLFFGLLACHVEGNTLEGAEVRPLRRDVTGQRTPIALEPFVITATPDWIQKQAVETVRRISDAQARVKAELWDGPDYDRKWMCARCEAFEICDVVKQPQFVGSQL